MELDEVYKGSLVDKSLVRPPMKYYVQIWAAVYKTRVGAEEDDQDK